jgi:hypothetical protein
MELLEFIVNNKPLTNKKFVTKKFVSKYDQQNNGLLDQDTYKFIRLYNKDVEMNYLKMDKLFKKHQTCLFSMGCHTVILFKNKNNDIEKYDSADSKYEIQWTSNNCTLYAGIVGIIRPLVKDMRAMINILRLVSDKPNTPSCKKLVEISTHYFGRGGEFFNYNKI